MGITIETFYWNANDRGTPVRVAKVPDSVPCTTGTIRTTDSGKKIALYSKRRVVWPEAGYRYHEFNYC